MKKLLSFKLKLVSEIPSKFSNSSSSFQQSRPCKNFTSLAKENPKQPTLSQPHSFSLHSFSFSSTPSWRSQHFVSEKISGFLANPTLLKQLASNAHFKIPNVKVFDRWIRSFRAQLPGRQLNFKSTSFNFNSSRRSWFPTADNIVMGLVGANVFVFILWRIADPTFMRKHFMISVENVTSGRLHTLITSAFSHKEIGHLVSNMFGLYFFGKTIGTLFGPEFLLKLYLAGAVTGSIFFLVHHAFMSENPGLWNMDPKRIPGLGASGAVNAIMLLYIFLFPTSTIYLELFIPVPAVLLGAFLIGKDILTIVQGNSEISGSAHLGGAVVAAVAWARIKGRWK
ncbi:hypothetical protein NE237_007207 [Protea cynaroides]|uniref:Peptidase S54 rhomboid domain-containing protein n=1 Tax=Protea cynaroides TaxID=273540 RepID=A0A9Q0KNV4_9MAGN|nr:hypothetical protein NE237_007207 [Protea cynaroides]